MVELEDVQAARDRIAPWIYCSPCERSEELSQRYGCDLHLKLENLQMTGSFKERGACNRLSLLTDVERQCGVVAASAGNHAQAVAYHARRLGIQATIVMPKTTPLVKVTATRGYGATVLLEGMSYDEAYQKARELEQTKGYVFIHAFNDEAVIAGQGTVALEILEQVPDVDVILSCVGGGGLIGGVGAVIKALKPDVRLVGVEPSSMPSMQKALEHHGPYAVPRMKTIADGAAVGLVGDKTYALASRWVDEVVSVDDEDVAEAILLLVEREKTVAEGAGALSLAAIMAGAVDVQKKRVVALISGGNIDVNLIALIIERGLTRSGRLCRMRVRMADYPGSLAAVAKIIADEGANVLRVNHDRVVQGVPLGQVSVELELETRGYEHIRLIEEKILGSGFKLL